MSLFFRYHYPQTSSIKRDIASSETSQKGILRRVFSREYPCLLRGATIASNEILVRDVTISLNRISRESYSYRERPLILGDTISLDRGISREYCREIVNTSNNVYQDRDIAFSEMSHTLFGCLLPRAISLKRNILFLKRILLSSGRPWTISLWEISPRPGCILFLDIISFERYLSRVWSQGSIFSREYYPESYSPESILDSVFPRQE